MAYDGRRPLASLTSRLVVTAVALVLLVSLTIGFATTLIMRDYLTGRLDEQVEESLAGALSNGGGPGPDDGPGRYSGVGTLTASLIPGFEAEGYVIAAGEHGTGSRNRLPTTTLAALADAPTDGDARGVDLPGLGSYRVAAQRVTFTDPRTGRGYDGTLVRGLPSGDVDDTITNLVVVEVLLGLLGVLAAGAAGWLVVRRQLRPLREVARTAERVAVLPLSSGEIELTERVPAHLTDAATEVGQVGASLNTLLDHVETSLTARQRSEQQVRQFVADASHELRTPLTTIKGYAELARRHPDDRAGVLGALDKVEVESTRMTALVEDLLLLARLDAGRPVRRDPVDLTRLLLEAVSDARVLAPGHHWRLDLPDRALEIAGDEQRLHQLVTNLLTNARRYTPAGTAVTVSAAPGRIVVHDDGPGFPAGMLERAFERFVRGDVARTRDAEAGAGLGLSLVRAIARAHGGDVWLTSRPGDTSVVVALPGGPFPWAPGR